MLYLCLCRWNHCRAVGATCKGQRSLVIPAGDWGRLSAPADPGQNPGGVQGAKPPEDPGVLQFYSS